MKLKIAKLISFIFHPVLLALLIPFLFIFKETASFSYGLKWVFFSSFFLFFTAAGFFFVRPRKFFTDFDISIKEERHIFYSIALFMSIIYFIVSLLFKGILFPLSIVALGIILGIVVLDIVTYYMKVSIHMTVATAYTVTIAFLFGIFPFLGFIWILPAMGWSRLTLKKHTDKELLAGMFLGLGITIITFFIGRSLLYVR